MFYIQTHTHTCTHVQSNTLLAPDAPRKKKEKKKKNTLHQVMVKYLFWHKNEK